MQQKGQINEWEGLGLELSKSVESLGVYFMDLIKNEDSIPSMMAGDEEG